MDAWHSPGYNTKNYTFGAYGDRDDPRPIIQYITPSTKFPGDTVWSNRHQIHLRNLRIISNASEGFATVWIDNCEDVTIVNCESENASGDGITADYTNNLLMENTIVRNNSLSGGNGGGFAGGYGDNLQIINCSFIDNGRNPLLAHNIYVRGLTNALLQGNFILGGSNAGIVLHGSSENVVIRENDIVHNNNGIGINGGYGEYERFNNITLENNRIRDNGDSQGYGLLLNSLTNSTITNNLIYANRLGPLEFSDGSSEDVPSKNVLFYHNVFYNHYYGVGISGSRLQDISLQNNIFYDHSSYQWGFLVDIDDTVPLSELTLDYNLYDRPTRIDGKIIGVDSTGYTLALYDQRLKRRHTVSISTLSYLTNHERISI